MGKNRNIRTRSKPSKIIIISIIIIVMIKTVQYLDKDKIR
jgi:hypothetical protein